MVSYSSNQNVMPVVRGVSYFLAHVPSMVRHGSKPSREIEKNPSLLTPILGHLQTFELWLFRSSALPSSIGALPTLYALNQSPLSMLKI